MSSKIPKELIDKIKEKYPEIVPLIDENQSYFFTTDGKFDEILFKKYIVEKRRAEIINEFLKKGGKISGKGRTRRIGRVLQYEGEELVNLERKVAQVVLDYTLEKTENTIQGAKDLVTSSFDSAKRELDISLSSSFAQIDAASKRMLDKYREYETDSKKIEVAVASLKPQIDKLKLENSRVSEKIKNVLRDNLTSVFETKISGLPKNKNFSCDDIKLTEEEGEVLSEKISSVIKESIENQRKIRTEAVNGFLGKAIGIDNSEGLVKFVKDSKYITDQQKEFLEEFISSGYLTDQEILSQLEDRVSTADEIFMNIEERIDKTIREKRLRENPVYSSQMWYACNGGRWAPFMHLATFGVCTGFTAGVGLAEAIMFGDWYRLLALAIVIAVIVFLKRVLPFILRSIYSIINGLRFLRFIPSKIVGSIVSAIEKELKKIAEEIGKMSFGEFTDVVPFENFRTKKSKS